jgi:hypothetical protein
VSAASTVSKEGDKPSGTKQIGVIRKKKDKPHGEDSDEETIKKLKDKNPITIGKI